jgi:hypothetical protein
MISPPPTLVSVGHGHEPIAAQDVDHRVLDLLDGGRKVSDPMTRIAVQHDNHDIRKETSNLLIAPVSVKQAIVDPWEIIQREPPY